MREDRMIIIMKRTRRCGTKKGGGGGERAREEATSGSVKEERKGGGVERWGGSTGEGEVVVRCGTEETELGVYTWKRGWRDGEIEGKEKEWSAEGWRMGPGQKYRAKGRGSASAAMARTPINEAILTLSRAEATTGSLGEVMRGGHHGVAWTAHRTKRAWKPQRTASPSSRNSDECEELTSVQLSRHLGVSRDISTRKETAKGSVIRVQEWIRGDWYECTGRKPHHQSRLAMPGAQSRLLTAWKRATGVHEKDESRFSGVCLLDNLTLSRFLDDLEEYMGLNRRLESALGVVLLQNRHLRVDVGPGSRMRLVNGQRPKGGVKATIEEVGRRTYLRGRSIEPPVCWMRIILSLPTRAILNIATRLVNALKE
ncbi:hypothetical protein B0H11DRAFT_2209196 [Mycena galericulata]|nr:hypothetical protein B0H11DRAFT_2209196 [Mycena galericulata]